MKKDLIAVTSMVNECSEMSTIFALKMSTNHMIWNISTKKKKKLDTNTK